MNDPSNSIVWSLKRLLDTPAEIERAERKSNATLRGPRRIDREPRAFTCRVCGFESHEPAFCPHCLADTMRPAATTP